MTSNTPGWYIVQTSSQQCEIVSAQTLTDKDDTSQEPEPSAPKSTEAAPPHQQGSRQWGPFESKNQAIAKRVGLIRAGHCKPM